MGESVPPSVAGVDVGEGFHLRVGLGFSLAGCEVAPPTLKKMSVD